MSIKNYTHIFILIILLSCSFNKVNSAESIVYLDMARLMKNSLAGKSLVENLKKYKDSNTKKFRKTLETLQSKEKNIISQKNVLAESEFKSKMKLLSVEFSNYQNTIKEFNKDISNKKFMSEEKIMKALKPILSEYSKKNSTSMILNRRNVITAKSELDITDVIVDELNKKIKAVKLSN